MKLELVSYTRCPYVHRAAVMMLEKGVAFETRYIDLRRKPDWFLAISPRGKVPVLVVDGTPIFESAAICELIDETHPPRMLPDDPLERARHRGWVEVCNDLLDAVGDVARAPDEGAFRTAREKQDDVIERFEGALAGPFFGGERFSLVDVTAAPALHRMSLIGELPSSPKARAWAERVASRPSVTGALPASFRDEFFGRLRERGSYVLRRIEDAARSA